MSRAQLSSSNSLNLYVSDDIASRLPGGIHARVFVNGDGRIEAHFTGGHAAGRERGAGPILAVYHLSGGPAGRWCTLQGKKVVGWGRKFPVFGKTDADTCTMRDVDGVPTLLLVMPPMDKMQRVRRTKSARATAPVRAVAPAVSGDDLRCLVQRINALKTQMGDDLVFSVVPDGTIRATVEYS